MGTSKGLRTQLVHLPPVAAQLIQQQLLLSGQRLVKLVRHVSFHPAAQEFVETLYPPFLLERICFACHSTITGDQTTVTKSTQDYSVLRQIGSQQPHPSRERLVSEIHRSSAYRLRRASLVSSSDTSGRTAKAPLFTQSCAVRNVCSALLPAPTAA